jgi:hypothetical protein
MPAAATIDAEEARLKRDLERQLRRAATYLRRAVDDGRVTRDVDLARQVAEEYAAILADVYGVVAPSFENAAQRVADAVGADVAEAAESFVTPSLTSMRSQVDGTLDRIAQAFGGGADAMRTLVVDIVRSNIPPTSALDQLQRALDATAAEVATAITTGLAGFDRAVNLRIAEDLGVEWFGYDGPEDRVTRPWCAARVGYRFTREMMDEIPNDTGPQPPSDFGGGYNCRHRWTPLVTPRQVAAYRVWTGA